MVFASNDVLLRLQHVLEEADWKLKDALSGEVYERGTELLVGPLATKGHASVADTMSEVLSP